MPAAIARTWSAGLRRRELHAPSLLWSEVAAALRQLEWRGEVEASVVSAALEWLSTVTIKPHESRSLVGDARRLAAELGWAKTYDAEYIALARRLGGSLVTLDMRLARTAAAVVDIASA